MTRLARFRPDLIAAGGTVHAQRKAINRRDFETRSPKVIAPGLAILLILFCSLACWAVGMLIIMWLPRLAW